MPRDSWPEEDLHRGQGQGTARASSQPQSDHLEEATQKFPLPITFFALFCLRSQLLSSQIRRSRSSLSVQKLPGLLTALDDTGIKLTARISSAFGFRSEHTATPTGLSELLHQAGHRRGQAFAREKRQSSQVIRSTPTSSCCQKERSRYRS